MCSLWKDVPEYTIRYKINHHKFDHHSPLHLYSIINQRQWNFFSIVHCPAVFHMQFRFVACMRKWWFLFTFPFCICYIVEVLHQNRKHSNPSAEHGRLNVTRRFYARPLPHSKAEVNSHQTPYTQPTHGYQTLWSSQVFSKAFHLPMEHFTI